jgi:hypothetical protein
MDQDEKEYLMRQLTDANHRLIEANAQLEQAKLEQEDKLNQRDNETKLLIANMQVLSNKDSEGDGIIEENNSEELLEKIREFNANLQLEREKLKSTERMNKENNQTKLTIAKLKPKITSNK